MHNSIYLSLEGEALPNLLIPIIGSEDHEVLPSLYGNKRNRDQKARPFSSVEMLHVTTQRNSVSLPPVPQTISICPLQNPEKVAVFHSNIDKIYRY